MADVIFASDLFDVKISIARLNINGGCESLCKVQVKQQVECNKVDISLRQETHSTDDSSTGVRIVS